MRIKTITILILCLCTNLNALDYIGEPSASLEKDQISLGMSYSNSEMDIELDNAFSDFLDSKIVIKDIEQDKFFLDIGLAGGDNVEVIFRIGTSTAQPDKSSNDDNIAGYIGESDDSFAFGGGVKFTLYKDDFMKWGFSAMLSHSNYGFDNIKNFSLSDVNYSSMEIDSSIIEAVISTGPTIAVNDYVKVYGGPFLHIISGDIEIEGTLEYPAAVFSDEKQEMDFRQDSILGGLVGAMFTVNDRIGLNIEAQRTNSATAVAGSFVMKF